MNATKNYFAVSICAGIVVLSLSARETISQPTELALRLETKIPLGNVTGRIDHLAIDLARHRLFVAELGNDTVGVIDLEAQKMLHRIVGQKEPQGVAFVPMNDSLYVANGGDGSVHVFSGPDYMPTGRIDLGQDADNIRVDEAARRLLVGYDKGAIGVIDLSSNAKIKSFALKAHPESFQFDAATRQIFVNLPNSQSIAVLDGSTGEQRTTWPLKHGGNFPMTLDQGRQRVLVVFRNPAKFAAFDWRTGTLLNEVDTCGDADDLFLDTKRNRIYISCGAGFIDVLSADDPKYPRLAHIPTVGGARTALFVPETDRLLLAVRSSRSEPAAIWVYHAVP